ncbi:ribonuclease J [Patescibacteria group bacterium]|nr:ribonuclease J [Patescibacteria group bacterium]MCG2701560.1 ribonuclease J [Candidatus Parcubacteria bacterium]MBU4210282.1 ribonuclease J [Patescibacteria group bacterium]MBU4264472.1 ribonuclease J [Patescibacteria group bacterium]MBU4390403.1 ribonuclease J [Patescibacteria group bacterium]
MQNIKNTINTNTQPNQRPQTKFTQTFRPKTVQNSDALRITSLGGFGDVTQNMFVYEYAPRGDFKKSQIIIVDCGVGFPEEDEFGVDLQIPDTKYLEDKKNRILGIFITHGHEDHIGALRFILPVLGKNIPIYAPRLATAFIQARLQEHEIRAKIQIYQDNMPMKAGPFLVDPIRVTHSIPDTFHFAISTPIGLIYHGSDFKFDLFPLDGKYSDLRHIARVGNNSNVLCLLSDCLGADHPGYSPSERTIAQNFENEIKTAKGRVFVTAISSNIVRWGQAIEYGKRAGRKIVTVGFSVDRAISVAQELGYIKLNKSDIVPINRIKNFPENQLIFLAAGFAGQSNSALSKMVMGKHRIKIKSSDKIIFSAPDYIPGTSSAILKIVDHLSKMGAEVVYGEGENMHVSGHGYQKEYALLATLLNSRYLLPIGGNYRHVRAYQGMALDIGYSADQFISPDSDASVTFYANGKYDTNHHISSRKILIDGFGVGDVGTTVLRDRRLLAEDGMLSVVLLVDTKSARMIKEPLVLSKGFVFMKENTPLINQLKQEVKKKFSQVAGDPINLDYVREQIQGHLEQIVYKKTGRQPMILPLLVEV